MTRASALPRIVGPRRVSMERALAATTVAALAAAMAVGALAVVAAGRPRLVIAPDPRVVLVVPARAPTPPVLSIPTAVPAAPPLTLTAPATPPARLATTPAATAETDGGASARAAIVSVVKIMTDRGLGTGFVLDLGGRRVVVTNAHVVDKANEVTLILPDGTERRAGVTARNPAVDLAAVDAGPVGDLPALRVGDAEALRAGEPLYVVGFPSGYRLLGDPSISRGVVSGRRVLDGIDYLQTDAAMNHGNSGGPVLNSAGAVVGVATRGIFEDGRVLVGINFAVPSTSIRAALG